MLNDPRIDTTEVYDADGKYIGGADGCDHYSLECIHIGNEADEATQHSIRCFIRGQVDKLNDT